MTDTPTLSPEPSAASALTPVHERDLRRQTPVWRIEGQFTLLTPLHIGTGRDARIDGIELNPDENDAAGARFVATVVRDHLQRPCVPGSSFKGALQALARRAVGLPGGMSARLFGADLPAQPGKGPGTAAGAVEFTYLFASAPKAMPTETHLPNWQVAGHPQVANLPHVSINRHTGAAEHQRLYLQQVLPPGAVFSFTCTTRGLDRAGVEALLGLLKLTGDPGSPFRLGAGQAADQGRVAWQFLNCRELAEPQLAELWRALEKSPQLQPAQLWEPARRLSVEPKAIAPLRLQLAAGDHLVLDRLALVFHSPFLVYQRTRKTPGSHGPDGQPRRNHAGRGILPGHSLHGALRAQAERILRTIGQPTPEGYLVPGVEGLSGVVKGRLDLASVLFGAPGWRSLLRIGDFEAPGGAPTLEHHMVAIDRLTGGGKDSAKFSIQALDCPTLTGTISLDLSRLRALDEKQPGLAARALGLLAHVLRDLDEGDIPLGYGASKGYGQLTASTLPALRNTLKALPAYSPAIPQDLAEASAAFSAIARAATPATPDAGTPAGWDTPPAIPTPGPVEGDFHNPYAFVPLGKANPDDPRLPWARHADIATPDAVTSQAHAHSHAHYTPGMHSGRLICRLTTRTPVFIGAGEAQGDGGRAPAARAKLLAPFKLKGQLALPATSLRGVLSSLHESVTRSAVRVMHETTYSVRQQFDQDALGDDPIGINTAASSALGRVKRVVVDGKETWSVLPLTLPTLEPGSQPEVPISYVQVCFSDEEGELLAFHKVLLEDAHSSPPSHCDYERARSERRFAPGAVGSDKFWYLPLEPLQMGYRGKEKGEMLWVASPSSHLRPASKSKHVIGQRPSRAGAYPLSQREYDQLPHAERSGWVRGLIRAMRAPGRDLPNTRKYEAFVPFPDWLDEQETTALPCTPACMQRFRDLADELFERQRKDLPAEHLRLPYTPAGRPRPAEALRLQEGDLVFFKPSHDGQSIAEISFSSIWRARVETENNSGERVPHGSLKFLPDPGMAPLGAGEHQSRLSPSELLFGAVEIRSKKKKETPAIANGDEAPTAPILAFAGKVRFGHARPLGLVRLSETATLKILSAPKPPSPAMYFHDPAQPGYVSKAAYLSKPDAFRHHGRKVYLHALRRLDAQGQAQVAPMDAQGLSAGTRMPWVSADPETDVQQKVRVQPIDAGQTFLFEVDYDNLTTAELDSLCAALRPHEAFEHKLGMGKPIGLGSVRIDIVAVLEVDRQARYAAASALQAPRYSARWTAPDLSPTDLKGIPHLLASVSASVDLVAGSASIDSPAVRAGRQMHALKAADPAAFQALALVGHASAVRKPVHYPQVEGADVETKTYTWFVDNAIERMGLNAPPQSLAPINASTRSLPSLRRQRRDPAKVKGGPKGAPTR